MIRSSASLLIVFGCSTSEKYGQNALNTCMCKAPAEGKTNTL